MSGFYSEGTIMENSWYIKEQCEKIRDDAEAIEGMSARKDIWELLQRIVVAAYKIEADAVGKDLGDLMSNNL